LTGCLADPPLEILGCFSQSRLMTFGQMLCLVPPSAHLIGNQKGLRRCCDSREVVEFLDRLVGQMLQIEKIERELAALVEKKDGLKITWKTTSSSAPAEMPPWRCAQSPPASGTGTAHTRSNG